MYRSGQEPKILGNPDVVSGDPEMPGLLLQIMLLLLTRELATILNQTVFLGAT